MLGKRILVISIVYIYSATLLRYSIKCDYNGNGQDNDKVISDQHTSLVPDVTLPGGRRISHARG